MLVSKFYTHIYINTLKVVDQSTSCFVIYFGATRAEVVFPEEFSYHSSSTTDFWGILINVYIGFVEVEKDQQEKGNKVCFLFGCV